MNRLLTALIIVLLVSPVAVGAQEVADPKVRDALVNVYCTYKSGSKNFSTTGSGVFIGDRGVVLTNAHVVLPILIEDPKYKAKCALRTGSPAKEAYTASLLYISPQWLTENVEALKKRTLRGTGEHDFALLYVASSTPGTVYRGLPIPTAPMMLEEADTVMLAGYPAEKLGYKKTAKKLVYSSDETEVKTLYSFLRPFVDLVTLDTSPIAQSGVSGGPVTTPAGELVGIMTAVEQGSLKDGRRVRAVTLPYINRSIILNTGTSLPLMIQGDLASRAALTKASLDTNVVQDIANAQVKRR